MNVKETVLVNNKHILLYNNEQMLENSHIEFDYIKENFCGIVISDTNTFNDHRHLPNTILYICGDIGEIVNKIEVKHIKIINIIRELSTNYEMRDKYQLINLGEVPINMFNVGIYFRNFFNSVKDYYDSVVNEHKFQLLSITNKPGTAYRTGIYLTKVEEDNDELKFKLLRCSTNLDGPTDNFRSTDNEIIDKVNDIARYFFREPAELNHVLAQTYHNTTFFNGTENKERKAKIAEHSDKTKDMPKNGLIVFCSFYKDYSNDNFNNEKINCIKSKNDSYDYCYKDTSVLTKLRFRLKKEVTDENYQKMFDIILYPNSVFLMSLSTNRLYTHEIIPSILPINTIPTRMGYVIRCSNTNAVFKDNQTYIFKYGKCFKLEEPSREGVEELKQLYLTENTTTEMMDYDDKFYFSLNSGDYIKPIV
jgi:hypothetical protein